MPPKNKLQKITLPSSSYLLNFFFPLVPNNDFFFFFFLFVTKHLPFCSKKKTPKQLTKSRKLLEKKFQKKLIAERKLFNRQGFFEKI
jgi:hypothetical protein